MSLEFIPPKGTFDGPLLPADSAARLALRRVGSGGEYESGSAPASEAACLRCPDTPCASYSLEEREGISTVPADVCPAGALRPAHLGMEITDACIGCGLCVLRCEFGAIRLVEDHAEVVLAHDGYVAVERDAAAAGRRGIVASRSFAPGGGREFIGEVQKNVGGLKQIQFYRFACSLLTALGLPARPSNAGDTSLRMDAVCPHPVHSLPVEIKSPTEVATADLKSVRQALENHVIMRGRKTEPTTEDTATLAIGHAPLPVRTDACELADDIEQTYGVMIRIFSTLWLLGRLVDRALQGTLVDTDGLRRGLVRE